MVMRPLPIKRAILLAAFLLSYSTTCLCQCPSYTTKGNDFWVTFLYNQNINSPTTVSELRIIATSDQSCTVNIQDPLGSVHPVAINVSNGMGSCNYFAGTNSMNIAQPYNGAYHVTSTEDIWLYARNRVNSTEDIAMMMPTSSLSTRYIVQGYPSTQKGDEVAFVATEDGTVLTMTVPCNIRGTSITAGTTLNVNLNSGQTYLLMTDDESATFSGMVVKSNKKPFAMFHGAWNPAVPSNSTGRDHAYEQAVAPNFWGSEFVVAGVYNQNGDNRVRITASDSNCSVTINGAVVTTLGANDTYEYILTPSQAVHILTSKPACVIMYLGSYQNNGIGDPSSVTIPPITRGICDNIFIMATSTEISPNRHYLTVISDQSIDASLRLNGTPLPSTNSTTVGNYTIHRVNLTQSINHIENPQGPFVAYCYGIGSWISYAYPLAMALDSTINDTLVLYDTTCVGTDYSSHGFSIAATDNSTTGNITLNRQETSGNVHTTYILHLTVLPVFRSDISFTIIYGDTLSYNDTLITMAGSYTFHHTASNGCDSIVTLHISLTDIAINASTNDICAGDEVILTATSNTFIWTATPPDPELDSQQGNNPVTVHPTVTTTYHLLDLSGNILASVTINTSNAPKPCVELSRNFIDFDHPVVTFDDCSDGRLRSTWVFSDGIIFNGNHIMRRFDPFPPDSIQITLISCNQYNCCIDTTISLPRRIRSLWFPNTFTPDAETNNRFRIFTSRNIIEFKIDIFNRWGLHIWSTNDLEQGWDGRQDDSTPCPQGVYVYKYFWRDADGGSQNGVGTVTLLR
jgi:gliding motility-associated-like protein